MKNVIHIFGAAGSGTTTLARRIEKELGFQFMDTDDYFWMPTNPPYTTKRPREERIARMVNDIKLSDNVVISGSLVGWGDVLIPYFTLAIRVHTATQVRLDRIEKREKEHFGSRIDAGGDMYETHKAFMEWAGNYDTGDTSMRSKAEHDAWQKLLPCELMEVDGENLLSYDLEQIRQKLKR